MKYMILLVLLALGFEHCDNPVSPNDAEKAGKVYDVSVLLDNIWREILDNPGSVKDCDEFGNCITIKNDSLSSEGFYFKSQEKIAYYSCNENEPDEKTHAISSLSDSVFTVSIDSKNITINFTFINNYKVKLSWSNEGSSYNATYVRVNSICN